jgi:Galactose mutarotase-like
MQIHAGVFLKRDGRKVTLWNRDFAAMNTDTNLYGSHPFLLELRADGTANGLFVANSNGMDVQLDKDSVTFRCATCSVLAGCHHTRCRMCLHKAGQHIAARSCLALGGTTT